MNRLSFADTKKKMFKGYWIRVENDKMPCPKCDADRNAQRFCKECKGNGTVPVPRFRHSLEKEEIKIGFDPACKKCGNVSREFKRSGNCHCSKEQCSLCSGKGCRTCHFTGGR